MFINEWCRCPEHTTQYPSGALCPQCRPLLEHREKQALKLHWKDIIPLDQQLDFMRDEHVYCRDEEHAFWSHDGRDANEKEKLRIAVLEKRAEFLKMFVEITIKTNEELLNVHKPKNSN